MKNGYFPAKLTTFFMPYYRNFDPFHPVFSEQKLTFFYPHLKDFSTILTGKNGGKNRLFHHLLPPFLPLKIDFFG